MVVGEYVKGCQVLVIGGGPGGYVAAIRAAQLGQDVVLVEDKALGGVCLNEVCIPSKALISATGLFYSAKHALALGIDASQATIAFDKTVEWKDGIVQKLSNGISNLCRQHQIEVIKGMARFLSNKKDAVEGNESVKAIEFEHAIIATGSKAVELSHMKFDHERSE